MAPVSRAGASRHDVQGVSLSINMSASLPLTDVIPYSRYIPTLGWARPLFLTPMDSGSVTVRTNAGTDSRLVRLILTSKILSYLAPALPGMRMGLQETSL